VQTAVVVAGGRSTRFGERDKAVADLAGTPMVRRVADRLEPVVSRLVVNCRADQRDAIADALTGSPLEVGFALDPEPDRGPVAGIRTGLAAVEDRYAAVLACDMPFVEPDLVEYLFEAAIGADAALPRVDGWFQPTQAVYRVAPMVEACDDALAAAATEDRQPRVLAPLDSLDWVVIEEATLRERGWLDGLRNVNTAAEFAAAADRLADEG
jgi:molybdopterin-guanine dinucleotide biosynthesis protein A